MPDFRYEMQDKQTKFNLIEENSNENNETISTALGRGTLLVFFWTLLH